MWINEFFLNWIWGVALDTDLNIPVRLLLIVACWILTGKVQKQIAHEDTKQSSVFQTGFSRPSLRILQEIAK